MAGVEEEGKGTRFVPVPCIINDGARIMLLSALKRWKRQVFGSTRLLQPLSVSTGLEKAKVNIVQISQATDR